jgi:hypothetical protein
MAHPKLCETYLASKQRRLLFPQTAKFLAEEVLKLATPRGNKYFLLLVDDHSRFMWLKLLESKDGAADAIKHFKAVAEVESSHTLRTFRSDAHGMQRHLPRLTRHSKMAWSSNGITPSLAWLVPC